MTKNMLIWQRTTCMSFFSFKSQPFYTQQLLRCLWQMCELSALNRASLNYPTKSLSTKQNLVVSKLYWAYIWLLPNHIERYTPLTQWRRWFRPKNWLIIHMISQSEFFKNSAAICLFKQEFLKNYLGKGKPVNCHECK